MPATAFSPLEFPLNMKWQCFWAASDCKYCINLFKLTDENLRGLQTDYKDYLLRKD